MRLMFLQENVRVTVEPSVSPSGRQVPLFKVWVCGHLFDAMEPDNRFGNFAKFIRGYARKLARIYTPGSEMAATCKEWQS